VAVTSVLFQPLPLADGDREAEMLGAVASRVMVTDRELVPPALVAEQVNVVPEVSAVTDDGLQPVEDVIADSGSVTDQVKLTLLVYQLLFPKVPVTVGVITGGVESSGVMVNVRDTLSLLLPALS
jgi:hypothetical protein